MAIGVFIIVISRLFIAPLKLFEQSRMAIVVMYFPDDSAKQEAAICFRSARDTSE